ncbi:CRISPR-associated helicase Cas3' [Streptomyces chrestomyceticus]|uniref:CRISPR-associated helicase Cas3' n=1 Tax=Streptomyces chrestomyceticus TaxID=68185 RepID=UPI0033C5A601
MTDSFSPDHDVWGKWNGLLFPYPLGCHFLDTAAIAGELWDAYLTEQQRAAIADAFGVPVADARGMVCFWAGLHDLGKCCPAFQGQPSGPDPAFLKEPDFAASSGWMFEGAVRHERVTHLVLPSLLAPYGYDATSRPGRSVAHQVAQILGGHHGVYGAMLDRVLMAAPEQGEPRVGAAAGWRRQRAALVGMLYEATGRPVAPVQMAPAGAAVMVTALVVLADWLASKVGWVRARLAEWRASEGNWQAHHRRAVGHAAQAVADAQLAAPLWDPADSFGEVFPAIRQPYPLQSDVGLRLPKVVSKGAGLLLVTAPTGDGKTEVGLYGARVLGAASGRAGLAVLLPTMATTEAMWQRVRDYVARSTQTDTPVTLLHGLAWLNEEYAEDGSDAVLGEGCVATTAGEFLRGRHLGLVAGVAVGTWDQAAMATLPVRFNVLRWLGLSGKTLIIDEAHAYDAYGHALTVRLLEWLGHLGVPVVLLSATLAGSLARRLVDAYLRGAGHPGAGDVAPAYPGWLFADAASGAVTASPVIESRRQRSLVIDLHEVRHTHDPDRRDGRAQRLAEEIAPLYEAGQDPGAVLVVCNTVPDAQQTFLALKERRGSRRPRLLLLHARMPVWQRDATTQLLLGLLGPTAARPDEPLIVVATQVAEQSLDVDFDLVISDLAPLAQLLQRAGRGHRHQLGERGARPSWAGAPRLVVCSPSGSLPPPAWGEVYDAALLRRTRDLLADRAGQPLDVPGEVAEAIETVYADLNDLADQALSDDRQRAVRETAQAAAADAVAIPAPHQVTDLYPLTDREIDPAAVTTRLGADSERLLPVYTTADGRRWLDPECSQPLPVPPAPQQRLDRDTVAQLVRLTVQAPGSYLPHDDQSTFPPKEWERTPTARDLRLLPHPVARDGCIGAYEASQHTLRLDPELGLVRRAGR